MNCLDEPCGEGSLTWRHLLYNLRASGFNEGIAYVEGDGEGFETKLADTAEERLAAAILRLLEGE